MMELKNKKRGVGVYNTGLPIPEMFIAPILFDLWNDPVLCGVL